MQPPVWVPCDCRAAWGPKAEPVLSSYRPGWESGAAWPGLYLAHL